MDSPGGVVFIFRKCADSSFIYSLFVQFIGSS